MKNNEKSSENKKNMTYIIINAYYTTYPCFRKHVDGVYTYSNTVTTCNELLDLILVMVPK